MNIVFNYSVDLPNIIDNTIHMKTNINLSLIHAIESNDYNKVYDLIKNEEADINYRTKDDETPLIIWNSPFVYASPELSLASIINLSILGR